MRQKRRTTLAPPRRPISGSRGGGGGGTRPRVGVRVFHPRVKVGSQDTVQVATEPGVHTVRHALQFAKHDVRTEISITKSSMRGGAPDLAPRASAGNVESAGPLRICGRADPTLPAPGAEARGAATAFPPAPAEVGSCALPPNPPSSGGGLGSLPARPRSASSAAPRRLRPLRPSRRPSQPPRGRPSPTPCSGPPRPATGAASSPA